MPGPRRTAVTVVLALAGGVVYPGAGCGTDAVGVDACRAIEEARCAAAAHCPEPTRVDDVAACQRFYRDQCLHGLDAEGAPSSSAVDRCVAAIEAAGRCAGDDPDQSIDACDEAALAPGGSGDGSTAVCAVIEAPTLARACDFLLDSPVEPGGAGAGGAGADAVPGGAGGAGGAAGAGG